MSFFEDVLYSAAPVAAGFIAGPAGYALAAGAATGAGIAAMRGQDPIMGAVTGGFGGASGAGLAGASGGLGSIPNANIASGATQSANNALMGGSTIPGNFAKEYAGSTAGTGTGITAGQSFKNMMSNPGQTLSNYGDGSKFKGAAKLGSLGLPAIGQALVPDYNANPDDDPMSKYDPKRRLNVNMPTGIQNAMTRDSGLRLNQPFARFAEGGYIEDYLYSDPVRRDQFGEMLEGIKSIPQNVREGTQFYLDQYREKKQNEAAEQQFRDDYPELQREIDTGRTAEEELQLRNFFRNNMAQGGYLETGMGDGMSDDIPSSIDGAQPAALSENEFVIPADVVSHLGNGSSDAGAEQLYAMMDRVRKARTGNEEQGRDIMPQEYMPA